MSLELADIVVDSELFLLSQYPEAVQDLLNGDDPSVVRVKLETDYAVPSFVSEELIGKMVERVTNDPPPNETIDKAIAVNKKQMECVISEIETKLQIW